MIKVLYLIFGPGTAWEKITRVRRGYLFILATYLLPLLLATAWLEGWGLVHWGKWQPKFQVIKSFTIDQAIPFEVCQFLLQLVTIFVCALMVLRVSQTFHERNKYLDAFTLTAYGFGPLLVVRLLDVFPGISPWASWIAGAGMTVWILYQGIPRVLQPDPTHAFGLYLSTVFVMVLTSALGRLITGMYLLGYMNFEHSYLTRELSRFFSKP